MIMSKVIALINSNRWAIVPEALQAILQIVNRSDVTVDESFLHHFSEHQHKNALNLVQARPMENYSRIRIFNENTAIVPITGPIIPRAELFSDISGVASVESVAKDFNTVLNNADIDRIILDVDSPGGSVTGISELSELIFNARGKKEIISYVSGMSASAAYWIASAASKMFISKTSEIGSIGVVATTQDSSEKEAKEGIKTMEFVSSNAPNKRPDYNSENGKALIQKIVDDLAAVFVGDISRNRAVSIKTVGSDFGQGGLFVGSEAVAHGLVDGVYTLEQVLNEEAINVNNLTGEQKMKNLKAITSPAELKAELKTENPELFAAVQAESKDLEQVKEESYKAGVEHENARLKGIRELATPENSKIIAQHQFDTTKSKGDIAILIAEHNKQQFDKAKEGHTEDAKELTETAEEVGSNSDVPTKEEDRKNTVGNMVAGGNRRLKQLKK